MLTPLSFLKIILVQILAFSLTSFLGARVFSPYAPAIRPQFKQSLKNLPQRVEKETKKLGQWRAPSLPKLPKAPKKEPPAAPTSLPHQPSVTPTVTISPTPSMSQSPTPFNLPPTTPTLRPPTVTPSPTAISLRSEEEEMINLINSRRQALGLSSLMVNSSLVLAARRHSQDTVACSSHVGSDGSTPLKRAKEAGYNGNVYGETVGCYPSPQAIVEAWWRSQPHREILTHQAVRVIGAGWWTNPYRQTAVVGD